MLIVIFLGLLILALVALFLKRRHDRRQDQIRSGFNAGITTRTTPMTGAGTGGAAADDPSHMSNSAVMATGALEPGSGRNSPARTREAFMPYGYRYTRSESQLASRTDVTGRTSPLARGGTPVGELEKEVGLGATPDSGIDKKNQHQRRVLVRERNGPESPTIEKM